MAKTEFEDPGTYAPPGPIGRTIRFAAGVLILYLIHPPLFEHSDDVIRVGWRPHMLGWLPGAFFAVWLLAVMIDRVFTLHWGHHSQAVLGLVAIVLSIFSFFYYGSFWGPPLGWLLVLTMGYSLGFLSLSFLVAAIFATPG